MKIRSRSFVFAAALAGLVGSFDRASAAPINPNDLILYRVGDGSAALSTTAASVFLDEYTTAGALVQTLPVSSSGTTAFTAVGTSTVEGVVNRSQNQAMLVFTGYRKNAGATDPSADAGLTTGRIIATLQMDGTIDTTINASDNPARTVIRSADTVDGSTYYYGTSSSVKYLATPGPASTSITIEQRKARQVVLADNVLFASTDATGTSKVSSYGTLPTAATTPTSIVTLVNNDNVGGLLFLDENPAIAGVDTLYLLSTTEAKLRKYSFDGAAWNSAGSLASTAQNLTGTYDGANTTLYLTTTTALQTLTDTSGFAGSLNGTITTLASAGANQAFRGLSVVPEPAGLSIVLVAPLLFRRRRGV